MKLTIVEKSKSLHKEFQHCARIYLKKKKLLWKIYSETTMTSSPKKSPGPQVHAHFFPQHSQERFDPSEDMSSPSATGQTTTEERREESDQPRRMYVREQFTHENTVRGNISEPSDSIIRR